VFPESWRRPFAIVLALHEQKHYTWPEWVDYFSAELVPEGHYPDGDAQQVEAAAGNLSGDADSIDAHYTEYWVAACEKLLVAKGILSKEEVDGLAPPPTAAATKAADAAAPRFSDGDRVLVRDVEPVGHAHLPVYLRTKQGVVERVLGDFTFPDADQPGVAEGQRAMYSVRFSAREVWGPDAGARDSLFFNIWEFYLERVPKPHDVRAQARSCK
jgi:nitrile hydratase